jgi:very-short-patch-repair endonuclease
VKPSSVVMQLGGVARTEQLLAVCTWREIKAEVERGRIVRVGRGRYVLREASAAPRIAMQLGGALAGPSAAQAHGWRIAHEPDKPWVSFPRNRKLSAEQKALINHIRTAARGKVTSPLQTVLDCARRLPFPDALAIADSALRKGDVGIVELLAAAAGVRGKGAGSCRRVAEHASLLAASPLESVLRALALDVLDVVPQVPIELPGFTAHPDLVDERLRIVLEADTWLFHGSTPEKFNRDVQRYTLLTAAGWLVLRFTYQEVMSDPAYVVDVLERAVALRREVQPVPPPK